MKINEILEGRPPLEVALMETFRKKGQEVYLLIGKLRYIYQGCKYEPSLGEFSPEYWVATFEPVSRHLPPIKRQFYNDANFNIMYGHRIQWHLEKEETEDGIRWRLYNEAV